MNTVARFMTDESGATAIEYGLIAALIAVGIIAAATTLGGSLSGLFNKISTKLNVIAGAPFRQAVSLNGIWMIRYTEMAWPL